MKHPCWHAAQVEIFSPLRWRILVLASVSVLSLGALGRSCPPTADHELVRYHGASPVPLAKRFLAPAARGAARVLGDQRFATAWRKQAAQIAEDLDRLATYALSEREALHSARQAPRSGVSAYRRR